MLEPTEVPFQRLIAEAFADVSYPQGPIAMGSIAAIEGDSQGAATLTAFTCLCPTHAGPEWRTNVFDKRAHRFNPRQAAAIVAFLEHPIVVDELILDLPDSPFVEDWKAALDYWRGRSDAPADPAEIRSASREGPR